MLTTPPHLQTRRPTPTTVEYTVSTRPPRLTLAQLLLQLLMLLLRLALAATAVLVLHATLATASFDALAATTASRTIAAARRASPALGDHLPPIITAMPDTNASRGGARGGLDAWTTNSSGSGSPTGPLGGVERLVAVLRWFSGRLSEVSTTTWWGRQCSAAAAGVPAAVVVAAAAGALYVAAMRLHRAESLLVIRGLGIQTTSSSPTWLWRGTTHFIPTDKIQDVLVNEAFRGFEVRYYLIVVVEGEQDVVVVFPSLLPRRHIVETVWRGSRKCLFGPEGRMKKG